MAFLSSFGFKLCDSAFFSFFGAGAESFLGSAVICASIVTSYTTGSALAGAGAFFAGGAGAGFFAGSGVGFEDGFVFLAGAGGAGLGLGVSFSGFFFCYSSVSSMSSFLPRA